MKKGDMEFTKKELEFICKVLEFNTDNSEDIFRYIQQIKTDEVYEIAEKLSDSITLDKHGEVTQHGEWVDSIVGKLISFTYNNKV